MKIQLESEDIHAIAETVVELLVPRLSAVKQVEEIFDKRTLAEYLHVEVSWIDKNLFAIPHFKVGKYVRFRQTHIDKWIEANKVTLSPHMKMVR